MRTRLAPLVALALAFAAIATACGSGSTTSDPYQIASSSMKATWSPVQVNVGFEAKDGATSISIAPSALAFVADKAAGTGAVHVSIPIGSLGIPAATLAQVGITGSTFDLDVVYDGQALYAKSPIFATVLTMLLTSSGDLPTGDLAGWLRIGTKEDLAALGSLAGGSGALPSFAAPSAGDASALKTALQDAGITLTLIGTERRDGADAYHLKAAIDGTKLLASKMFDSVSRTQIDQMTTAMKDITLSADIWVDKVSSHVVEIDGHVAATKDATRTATVTVKLGNPDGSVSTAAPSSFVEVPLKSIITNVMSLIGQGLTGG
ncbi:MAG: hypothetical protein HY264_03170 [Chloroflexi bacterium]|nr:hypothetical protein [Chloroflexota bacterium]